MQEPKKYDLVFALGSSCACSIALRNAGLQQLSMPLDSNEFDLPDGKSSLSSRLAIMESGFADCPREKDPDFMKFMKDKYDRRAARFMSAVKEAKTCILSVYIDSPGTPPADVGT